ncbi:chemotaxis protein CheB [Candidatus Magnetaquicoccus inordinatus]|uniref:chemotaxis protein CheB n=1 Tax=Candidatus Magnetaquicoccus inordinatus TaxID=2496818 RepID=UPI00102C597D|nr:chemotaxis protein CheB [Candidatus Magnetaquicoccus inordinatus]
MMWPIRVLVADDCPTARGLIQMILEQDPRIKVVAMAGNGKEALACVEKGGIDLVTLDISMPVMDGLQTISRIMATAPLPIVVISGTASSETAFKALASGALEVIAKDEIDYENPQVFRRKIMLLSTVAVGNTGAEKKSTLSAPAAAKPLTALAVRHDLRGYYAKLAQADQQPTGKGSASVPSVPETGALLQRGGVVVIASSTGGPKVLAGILRALPSNFPYPVIISQHIVPSFIHSLIKWHSGLTALPMQLAKAGERAQAGTIYYAQPEYHLSISGEGEFVLTAPVANEFFCPSGDKLLASAAQCYGRRTIAVVLTGIGDDGAKGAGAVHAAGGVVIAQDEATSIVYGMPKAVADAGYAHYILPAGEIDGQLLRLLTAPASENSNGFLRSRQ